MYPLHRHAAALVHRLSSLAQGDPGDDLIVKRLVRILDGRYELTASGAALRAGLIEIIDSAASSTVIEAALDQLFSDLEAIGAGLDIPSADALHLEHIALCKQMANQTALTPAGEWLRNGFRAATAAEDVRAVPFEFGPSHAFGVAV